MKLLIDDSMCNCGAVAGVALCDYCGETRCDDCAREYGCPVACSGEWNPDVREEAA
jgi:hypothetical protein